MVRFAALDRLMEARSAKGHRSEEQESHSVTVQVLQAALAEDNR